MMKFEALAKENEGKHATDQEFASAIGLHFYIDGVSEVLFRADGSISMLTDVELSLWEQLRHAYGFEVRGTCNSKHLAQLKRQWEAKGIK